MTNWRRLGREGLAKFITGLTLRDVPGEQIATAAQDAVDVLVGNHRRNWTDFEIERPKIEAAMRQRGWKITDERVRDIYEKAHAQRMERAREFFETVPREEQAPLIAAMKAAGIARDPRVAVELYRAKQALLSRGLVTPYPTGTKAPATPSVEERKKIEAEMEMLGLSSEPDLIERYWKLHSLYFRAPAARQP